MAGAGLWSERAQAERTTLPALMHDVQTLSFFGVLPTTARTVWMFGFHRRGVRRCECEMLLPKPGPLPQTSQLAATGVLLKSTLQNLGVDLLTWRRARASDAEVHGNRSRVAEGRGNGQNEPLPAR